MQEALGLDLDISVCVPALPHTHAPHERTVLNGVASRHSPRYNMATISHTVVCVVNVCVGTGATPRMGRPSPPWGTCR
jgi:hypothetical protein